MASWKCSRYRSFSAREVTAGESRIIGVEDLSGYLDLMNPLLGPVRGVFAALGDQAAVPRARRGSRASSYVYDAMRGVGRRQSHLF
jgi:hypothetical protein